MARRQRQRSNRVPVQLLCNRCGGTHFRIERRGVSLLRSLAGWVLHGKAGIPLGLQGVGDREVECLRCHLKITISG